MNTPPRASLGLAPDLTLEVRLGHGSIALRARRVVDDKSGLESHFRFKGMRQGTGIAGCMS